MPLSNNAIGRETRLRTPLLFVLIVLLLLSPAASLQGQVISSSDECNIGLNGERATCSGWVKCYIAGAFSTTTFKLNGYVTCNMTCPGHHRTQQRESLHTTACQSAKS